MSYDKVERIILKSIKRKLDGIVWTGLIWVRLETAGDCEHGNEMSGSIKV